MARSRHDNSRQGTRKGPDTNTPEAGGRTPVQWLTVSEDQDGQRLDNFLLASLRGVPRSLLYRIIRKGEVRVNKGRAKPDTRIRTGDQVRVPPVVRPARAPAVVPGDRVQAAMEEAVIHEDDGVLVINKPSGIAVHGGSGLDFGLIEVLRAARPEAKFLELVHRLDRDTSGLVMIAKKRSVLRYLQDELRKRRVRKVYRALVSGRWPANTTEVNAPLLRYELGSGERRVRVSDSGKQARTRFRVLELFDGYTLVEAAPVSGRTHQIRVHSLHAGHPIAGDDKYMDDASLKAFRRAGGGRLMLHACELVFRTAEDGPEITVSAPYDEAFGAVLQSLRTRRT